MRHIAHLLLIAAPLGACSLPSLPSMSLFGDTSKSATSVAGELTANSTDPAGRSSGSVCRLQSRAQVRAESLIVQIKTTFNSSGAEETGAGILIAARGGTAFILTARHVVHKDRAGAPSIRVVSSFAPTGANATLSPRFQTPEKPYSDLAVIEARMSEQFGSGIDWQALRDPADSSEKRDFVVIGNPAGRGTTTTTPGPADITRHEVRVNSGVMEPGYSGGGIFDQHRRLAGIAIEDGGQFAIGYPIETPLALVRQAGLPVDLRAAPKQQPGVQLASVDAKQDAVAAGLRSKLKQEMSKSGYDPDCVHGNSYKLLITAQGWKESGSTSMLSVNGMLRSPGGAQLALDEERIGILHLPHQSPLTSREWIEDKSAPIVEKIVASLERRIAAHEATTR
jgi:hypothetical protein